MDLRVNEHRNDIKHNRNKPVAEHFNKPDHNLESLRLAVIKKVKRKTKQQREVEEQKIIFKFNCVNKGLKSTIRSCLIICNVYFHKREDHS